MVAISIVIPVYNVEMYISKTLNSLINQTFKNFEIIVVNDGSSDSTREIAEEILKESNLNYTLINQRNCGVSSARNAGLKKARGEYIYFIDGDDWAEPTLLYELYNQAQLTKADIVFCGYDHVDINGERKDKGVFKRYLNSAYTDGKEAARKMLCEEIWIWINSGLYRRSILKENNIVFDPSFKYNEDVLFTLRALYVSDKVTCVQKELVHYLKRDDSAINTANQNYIQLVYALEKFNEYLNHNDIYTKRFLNRYKIPKEIIRTFSYLCRNNYDQDFILDFIKQKNIKKYLISFKIKTMNFSDIKQFFITRILYFYPKLLKSMYVYLGVKK